MNESKIISALANVSAELSKVGVGKDGQCYGGGNFKYRSIDGLYKALSPLLANHKVVIVPAKVETLYEGIAGKQRLIRLHVSYTAYCAEDGSSISFESFGEGADMSDKCVGKAMSYAYKTAVFQLLCIPVEGTPDTDAEAIEPEAPFVERDILAHAQAVASGGTQAFTEMWKGLSQAKKTALKPHLEDLKKIAEAADAEANNQ